jgi:ribosomal protein S18 acetylase RimI-like enzyme
METRTKPVIRPLDPGDRGALETALRSDRTFRDDEVEVALELIDEAIGGSKDYWIRVATVDDGAVAGYICYGPTPMTASTYDLYWIVTHADHRGRGVAGSLIGAMEEDLRGRDATGIRVETSQLEGYGAARKLYARYGYPEAARFQDFYKVGDDLIVYYKRL